jgi:hypothetical protein
MPCLILISSFIFIIKSGALTGASRIRVQTLSTPPTFSATR